MNLSKEKIKEALARGYCTKRNKHKVLDPDLIEDMAEEVGSLPQQEVGVCKHDWQPEWYPVYSVTSNADEKKWRCKKCLITRFTYN